MSGLWGLKDLHIAGQEGRGVPSPPYQDPGKGVNE